MNTSQSACKSPWQRRLAWIAVSIAFALVCGTALRPILEQRLYHTESRRLGEAAGIPCRPEVGKAFICDLGGLNISDFADSSSLPVHSPLVLTENGRPLKAHMLHDDIRTLGGGRFSHWGRLLYFSTTDGTDPNTNGRVYEISFPAPAAAWVSALIESFSEWAILLLLATGALMSLVPTSDLGRVLGGRPAALLLGLGLAVYLAVPVTLSRNVFAFEADSMSYTEAPGVSSRPPGYYLLMKAVTEPSAVLAQIREMTAAGKINTLIDATADSPMRRVVRAQRTLLAASVLVLFVSLCLVMSPPYAAAAAMVAGTFTPFGKGDKYAVAAVSLLWVAPVVVAAWRRKGGARWLGLGLAAAALWASVPIVAAMLGISLLPAQTDFVMSESLATACVLVCIASMVAWTVRRGQVWLVLAAVGAAAAYLTRPAAIYSIAFVLLSALLAALIERRASWAAWIGTLCVFALAMKLPDKIKQWRHEAGAGTSTLAYSLASYALTVATPSDLALMPTPDARLFLERSIRLRDKARHDFPATDDYGHNGEVQKLGFYMYQIALPESQRIIQADFPHDAHKQAKGRDQLLRDVSIPIYKAHARELAVISLTSFRYALSDGSRLSLLRPLWVSGLVLLALAALHLNRITLLGACACLIQPLHMGVVSLFDIPIDRYVYATEYCVVLGVLLILCGLALPRGFGRETSPADPTPETR